MSEHYGVSSHCCPDALTYARGRDQFAQITYVAKDSISYVLIENNPAFCIKGRGLINFFSKGLPSGIFCYNSTSNNYAVTVRVRMPV